MPKCFVAGCENIGISKVPYGAKDKKAWFEIAKKDVETAGKKSTYYCCDPCKTEILKRKRSNYSVFASTEHSETPDNLHRYPRKCGIEPTLANVTSSQKTCLLCLSTNKNTINFYSDCGMELNIISILATHFWFKLEDQPSHNICCDCWKNTESFHTFYQSIQMAHKILEKEFVKIDQPVETPDEDFFTEFVKIENVTCDGEVYQSVQEPIENVADDGEIYQPVQVRDEGFITECIKIESDEDVEVDKEIYQPIEIVDEDEDSITEFVKMEYDVDVEDDESSEASVYKIPQTNSSETRAFNGLSKESPYLGAYDKFMTWKTSKNIDKDSFSEGVVLQYFNELKTTFKIPALWVQYSLLKTTIQKKCNIDITYPAVTSLLKKCMRDYQTHKTNVFQPDEIKRFLSEAPDNEFLAMKVIMIFSMYGVSSEALTKIEVKDVSEQGSKFVIKQMEMQTYLIRSFTLESDNAEKVRKYKQLRPANVAHDRFFINYEKEKCTTKPIGYRKILNAPKVIAKFLKLEEADNYTSHSFRRESIPNKTAGLNIEQINFDRSTEPVVTSTITSSGDTYTISMCENAEETEFDLLPESSQSRYLSSYNKFMAWKTDERMIDKESFPGAVVLEYFNYLKTKYKPTSLWVEFSMLRITIQKKHNVDISYSEVKAFLKTNLTGYQPPKFSVLQPDEMRRFLHEAEDDEFLAVKVIMIFGIFGITGGESLSKVNVNDISEQGSVFVVNIPDAKTKVIRSFILENEYATYVRKYKQLRPENLEHDRFFITHQNGKCTVKPLSRERFRNAPKIIANFLNLTDVESYTSHSFGKKRNRCRGGRSSGGVAIEECSLSKRKKTEL